MTLKRLLDQAAILAIVSVLGCVQTPIDLLGRLLSRQAIFLATMAIVVVMSAAAIVNRDLTSAAFSLDAVVQLLASTYGAVHGILVRKRSGQADIPFGPHLLVAAWLVLLASV